jgi:hypothetical protein
MIKKLLGEWLEERRKRGAPPLPSDAAIYMMAFVEWADKQVTTMQRTTQGKRRNGIKEK